MKNIFFGLIMLLFLSSCQEVIPIDLDTSSQRHVIEAVLDGTDGTCTVTISKSGGFYQSTGFEKIGGAQIQLLSANGEMFDIYETTTQGVYQANDLTIVPFLEYTITINNVEGTDYQASTIAPQPVALTGLEPYEDFFLEEDEPKSYIIIALLNDPKDVENFYRVKPYLDGESLPNDFTVDDDRFFDGEEIEIFGESTFDEGEFVEIELQSIDKKSHNYFYQLIENNEKTYNPIGNFNGNALGYFGIHFSDRMTIQL